MRNGLTRQRSDSPSRAYRAILQERGQSVARIVESGYRLPTVEAPNVERFPELDDELRVPNFIVVVLGKPANA
jgi:hypothetical protein